MASLPEADLTAAVGALSPSAAGQELYLDGFFRLFDDPRRDRLNVRRAYEHEWHPHFAAAEIQCVPQAKMIKRPDRVPSGQLMVS
jgi:hypothetical protein